MDIGSWSLLVVVCLVFVALGLWVVGVIFPAERGRTVDHDVDLAARGRGRRRDGRSTAP